MSFATDVSATFPYDSAYLPPAFVCGDETLKDEAGDAITPLAVRHHGLDIANNTTTSYFIGRHTSGARWLTFLSEAVAENAELDQLAEDPLVEVVRVGHGVRIRASAVPEIADTNRRCDQ